MTLSQATTAMPWSDLPQMGPAVTWNPAPPLIVSQSRWVSGGGSWMWERHRTPGCRPVQAVLVSLGDFGAWLSLLGFGRSIQGTVLIRRLNKGIRQRAFSDMLLPSTAEEMIRRSPVCWRRPPASLADLGPDCSNHRLLEQSYHYPATFKVVGNG